MRVREVHVGYMHLTAAKFDMTSFIINPTNRCSRLTWPANTRCICLGLLCTTLTPWNKYEGLETRLKNEAGVCTLIHQSLLCMGPSAETIAPK